MSKARVMLRPISPLPGTDATLLLTIAGVRSLKRVTLELHEAKFKHENDAGTDEPIGVLKGAALGSWGSAVAFTVALDESGGVEKDIPKPTERDPKKRVVAIVLPHGGEGKPPIVKFFALSLKKQEELERSNWFLFVKMIEPDKTESNRVMMTLNWHSCVVGEESTYDWHAHNEVRIFAHGHDEAPSDDHPSAFDEMVEAIKDAKHFIFITDWSFQPYFRIIRQGPTNPGTIGRLLLDRAKAGVLVGVIAWRHVHVENYAAPDEHNNMGDDRLRALNGNAPLPDNFLWRLTHNTATYSHHQKFVVLDAKVKGSDKRVIKAYFGGLDLTKGRHDWGDHIIDPNDANTAAVKDFMKKIFVPVKGEDPKEYDDWYSAEFQTDSQSDPLSPRQPWHDIYASITGPSAWDIVKEWVGRWNDWTANTKGDWPCTIDADDKGDATMVPTKKTQAVNDLYAVTLHDSKKFIQQYEPPPSFDDADTKFRWAGQVLRSMKREYWETRRLKGFEQDFKWPLKQGFEHSIQDAYLRNIRAAQDYILIETQYFISSGNSWNTTTWSVKNSLAEAICDKIIERKKAGAAFHCYVVCPMWPEGPPLQGSNVPQNQRFFEWQTMEYMIGRLDKETGDWKKYLSFYFPGKNGAPTKGALVGSMFKHTDGTRSYYNPAQSQLIAPGTVSVPLTRLERVRLNNRYMIYVHSKLMVVDDQYMILGSANLNERSLAGDRDTEICVHIWPKFPKFVKACKEQMTKFRKHLFKEHFGDDSGDPKSWGKDAQKIAVANYWKYRKGQPITQGHCMMLPFTLKWESHIVGKDTPLLRVEEDTSLPEMTNELLPDAPENNDEWKWWSTKKHLLSWLDLAE